MNTLPIETIPKKRKKRKPMSEEQKAAAGERLAKAREIRAKANPPKNVAKRVLDLDDDNALSLKNIKRYISASEGKLAEERKNLKSPEKRVANKAIAKVNTLEKYIRNLKKYISGGTYIDLFYGENQECAVTYNCIAMAYDSEGNPKRTIGVYYSDIKMTWTEEMGKGSHQSNDSRGGKY